MSYYHEKNKNSIVILPYHNKPNGNFRMQSRQSVLNIYNWGQYIDTDLLTKFEKETGIKVVYELFETNEHMLAK